MYQRFDIHSLDIPTYASYIDMLSLHASMSIYRQIFQIIVITTQL